MKNVFSTLLKGLGGIIFIVTFIACSKHDTAPVITPIDTTKVHLPPFDINNISDTYIGVSSAQNTANWGPYNVHDPSIFKDGDYFYCYSTDVAYGTPIRPGIQIRKSKDLVNWLFVGWVFDGLPTLGSYYITQNGGKPLDQLWAPYILKVGTEYRLYYSLSAGGRLSTIGLATASTPVGPWTEKGLVVSSVNNNAVMTNAIDPTVLVDQQGQHWMYYGSGWDGIYILKLDPTTGLSNSPGTLGKRVAYRGSTGGIMNGNLEGPEITYNKDLKKYFLFMAYDWLTTKYNVRVGRADAPEGPFLDYTGADLNTAVDHTPMIIAPYQFQGHGGWQGTSHCSVFSDNGQFYIAHQGRPGVDFYYMDLHVRKLFWTSDGWPVASPERYAATAQTAVAKSEVTGKWESIILGYQVVPGYDKSQVSPNFQTSVYVTLDSVGTINGDANSKWVYTAPWLELDWSSGEIDKVIVERGRDWEKKTSCLIFTGLDAKGTAVWGKK